ncbi:MAG: hypothetical protein GX874_14225 [Smithella sp.]|nr:hypothetical protein [Smithella sp.]
MKIPARQKEALRALPASGPFLFRDYLPDAKGVVAGLGRAGLIKKVGFRREKGYRLTSWEMTDEGRRILG